jgi:hypothetical protein
LTSPVKSAKRHDILTGPNDATNRTDKGAKSKKKKKQRYCEERDKNS